MAQRVALRLGAPEGGEYRRWLAETVGELHPAHPAVLQALAALPVILATTNYDSLLAEAADRPPVTWRDAARCERVARRDEPGILHLHGHWREPASVVLDDRAYQRLLGDAHAQAMQMALRSLRTLVFVGCGNGLKDPNFDQLLSWSAQTFSSSSYHHFRLCRNHEVDPLGESNGPSQCLLPVPIGSGHKDLARFLRRLQPGRKPSSPGPRPGVPPPLPTSPARVRPPLPPLPNFFGREDLVEEVSAALLFTPPEPLAILGPPGVGKTTVALAVLHHPAVAASYGPRRVFVRCDAATGGREPLLAATATALGLDSAPHLEQHVYRRLGGARTLLVFDNLETPWDADPLAVEELLGRFASLQNVAILATIRGEERPEGPRWREPIRLRPLDLASARRMFLAVAGQRHAADPQLDALIEAVDALPIAINLLAHHAESLPELGGLLQRWREERSDLLVRFRERSPGLLSGFPGRTPGTNVLVSVGLSLRSPRMTPAGTRLLSLLALLPDGLATDQLEALLPAAGAEAAAALRRTGLAAADDPRLHCLAPIRAAASQLLTPEPADLQRLTRHYLDRALQGRRAGYQDGTDAVTRLRTDFGNLTAVLGAALAEDPPDAAIEAALALGKFQRFTGLVDPSLLGQALEAARRTGKSHLEAHCISALADLAFLRFDLETARSHYEEALRLFRQAGHVSGQATCIESLGDIAFNRSDHGTARPLYTAALTLYRQVSSVEGEANCLQELGEIAIRCSEYPTARPLLEEALRLSRHLRDVLGEAACLQSQAHLALQTSDFDGAQSLTDTALRLYQRLLDVRGEATCVKRQGDIALVHSDHATAHERPMRAQELYHQVGDLLGQADCIKRLGDLALSRSQVAAADSRFAEALELYRRVGFILGEAGCLRSQAETTLRHGDRATAQGLYEEALQLYRRVGSGLGMATCRRALGNVAFAAADFTAAHRHYKKALPTFRRLGNVLGEANCTRGLADIALLQARWRAARANYTSALALFRQKGARIGEANCLQGLGDLAAAAGHNQAAQDLFAQALQLFSAIPDPYAIGHAQLRLAATMTHPRQQLAHQEAARKAWSDAGLDDLVALADSRRSALAPEPARHRASRPERTSNRLNSRPGARPPGA